MTDIFIRPHNSDRCNLVTHISSMDVNNEEAMVTNGPSSMSTRKRKAVMQALKETYQVSNHVFLVHLSIQRTLFILCNVSQNKFTYTIIFSPNLFYQATL